MDAKDNAKPDLMGCVLGLVMFAAVAIPAWLLARKVTDSLLSPDFPYLHPGWANIIFIGFILFFCVLIFGLGYLGVEWFKSKQS
jgi:hypothetical protein